MVHNGRMFSLGSVPICIEKAQKHAPYTLIQRPPKAEVTGSLLSGAPVLTVDRIAAVWKGSSWRMSALLALFSIAMIGYLYGCKTDDR